MGPLKIVMDTNVLVSAVRSSLGASHRLLLAVGDKRIQIQLSVPLLLEYEAAIKDPHCGIKLSNAEKDDILDYLCSQGKPCRVHYLWRPCLKDPGDDMVLEAAVASDAAGIVTFNRRDFKGVEAWGLRVYSPHEILRKLGGRP